MAVISLVFLLALYMYRALRRIELRVPLSRPLMLQMLRSCDFRDSLFIGYFYVFQDCVGLQ
jgi:hypothetical protein